MNLDLDEEKQKWFLICQDEEGRRERLYFNNKKEARFFHLGSQLYCNNFSGASERSNAFSLPEINYLTKDKLIHLGSQFHFVKSQLEKSKKIIKENLSSLNLRDFNFDIILKIKFKFRQR